MNKIMWLYQNQSAPAKIKLELSSSQRLIKSHCNVLTFDVMKLLIENLVFSHLSYSVSVWGVSLKQHLVKRLERLHNCRCCSYVVSFTKV